METIFDHAPTAAELSQLFLVPPTREEYEAIAGTQDDELGMIAQLYTLRGDDARAQQVLSRIRDPQARFTAGYHDVLQSEA